MSELESPTALKQTIVRRKKSAKKKSKGKPRVDVSSDAEGKKYRCSSISKPRTVIRAFHRFTTMALKACVDGIGKRTCTTVSYSFALLFSPPP